MSTVHRISTVMREQGALTEPEVALGAVRTNDVANMRDGLYAALKRAVAAFGGESKLADAIGASLPDTHLRLNRKEDSKMKLQRAFYDFLAPLVLHVDACEAWLTTVCELLGYEPPVKKRVVTDEEVGRGAVAWLKTLPPSMREAARADIAASLGIKPEALKL